MSVSDTDEGERSDEGAAAPASAAAPPDTSVAGKKRKRPIATELAPEKLAAFEEAEKRKGLIYLSRIPPFMKPTKIRHLLEPYGKLGRIYLAPEDPVAHAKRVKAGGNKKEKFTEGWIEFADKREAKAAAELLNNQPVEPGKKHSFYSADLWNIRYLHRFKWHHLNEKVAYEKRVRAQKLRAQLSSARKEAETYVERATLARDIREKQERLLLAAASTTAAGDAGDGAAAGGKAGKRAAAGGAGTAAPDARFARKGSAWGAGAADDDDHDEVAGAAAAASSSRPAKRAKTATATGDAAGAGSAGEGATADERDRVRRHFRQRQPLPDTAMALSRLRRERETATAASS